LDWGHQELDSLRFQGGGRVSKLWEEVGGFEPQQERVSLAKGADPCKAASPIAGPALRDMEKKNPCGRTMGPRLQRPTP